MYTLTMTERFYINILNHIDSLESKFTKNAR